MPPRTDPAALDRIKAFGDMERLVILDLSPRILPRLMELVGSTVITPTLWPWAIALSPKASIRVLFPAPGEPLIAYRIEFLPASRLFSHHCSNCTACLRSS